MISVSKKEVVYCPFCKKLSWKSCHCKTFLAGSPEAYSIRLAKGAAEKYLCCQEIVTQPFKFLAEDGQLS